jgi:hypothetical protein
VNSDQNSGRIIGFNVLISSEFYTPIAINVLSQITSAQRAYGLQRVKQRDKVDTEHVLSSDSRVAIWSQEGERRRVQATV